MTDEPENLVVLRRLETKVDRLETKVDRLDTKADRLETKVDRLETRTDRLETKVDALDTKADRLETRTDRLETKVDRMSVELAPMRSHLDGMPSLHRNLSTTQSEMRMLAAAFNDFALTNVTKGEIEALHVDVNRVQAENATLAARMETAERLIRELQEALQRD